LHDRYQLSIHLYIISGTVNQNREAIPKLVIIGDENCKIAVDAVINTGFNGDLILPPEAISELGLKLQEYSSTVYPHKVYHARSTRPM
jgi:predicted aspartyl protease